MTKTILINKDNRIKKSYIDKVDLVATTDIEEKEILVEQETLYSFNRLKEYLKNINIEIGICSGYRTLEEQEKIENYYRKKYGQEYCDLYVAPAGYSEHHTGLAIDFYIKIDGKYPINDPEVYKDIDKYEEVSKYLKDYGFILRYPKGKENITGYAYEPWHIRYVGKFVANIIYSNNLTLEEYLSDFKGLIAVNKEKGMTSFDVVNTISKLFGIKKVGHTGTLDPIAEGVLIVAIGKATKIVELVTSETKEYISTVVLGKRTDTKDITGKVIEESNDIDTSKLEEVIKSFEKTYEQEVPIYSAVKVKGKKLYEYARNNESIELPKKEVTIEKIDLLDVNNNEFTIRTKVSKGTYIRSLIDDIGEELGCHATMKTLTRTKQASINIEESYTLDEIANNNYKLLSIEYVLDYPVEVVDKTLEKKIRNGQKVENRFNVQDKIIFKNKYDVLLGIYEVDKDMLKTWKNFTN